MKVLERILLAVDFHDATNATVSHAAHLANTFDAEIVLAHAIESNSFPGVNEEEVRQHAQEKLAEVRAKLDEFGAPPVHEYLRIGSPTRVILGIAAEEDVNAIVIGATCSSITDRLITGTTAEEIARGADIPVFVHHPDNGEGCLIKRILCAVDYTDQSHQAVTTAAHLCHMLKARLDVLHVVADRDWFSDEPETEKMAEERHLKTLTRFLRQHDLEKLELHLHVAHGAPDQMIRGVAEGRRSDLLVMGCGANDMRHRIFGSTLKRVLRTPPCSLLLVENKDVFRPTHENILVGNDVLGYVDEHYNNARELLSDGLLEDAVVEFRFCIDRDPTCYSAYEGMAEAYRRLGNPAKAAAMEIEAADTRRNVWYQSAAQHGVRRERR